MTDRFVVIVDGREIVFEGDGIPTDDTAYLLIDKKVYKLKRVAETDKNMPAFVASVMVDNGVNNMFNN